MKENKKINSKILVLFLGIATLIVSVTGATYAYFALNATNNNVITGTTATTELLLSVTEQPLKANNTGKMVPQLYAGIGTAINTTNKCVDANGNIVCKVYEIVVTNNSSAGAIVNGTIQFTNYSGSNNLRWRRIKNANSLDSSTTGAFNQYGVKVVTGAENVSRFDLTKAGTAVTTNQSDALDIQYVPGVVCIPSNSSYNDDNHCTDIILGPSTDASTKSATYYIVVWLRETGADQKSVDAGKTFTATITFEGQNGTGVTSTITG